MSCLPPNISDEDILYDDDGDGDGESDDDDEGVLNLYSHLHHQPPASSFSRGTWRSRVFARISSGLNPLAANSFCIAARIWGMKYFKPNIRDS